MNLTLDIKQAMMEGSNSSHQSVITRETNPWKPERMARILKEVSIGWDIDDAEWNTVQDMIAEFADCFALSMKEVNAILGAIHKLNILEGITFRTKIPPRSYNPDQEAFMEAKIYEMPEAGIISSIHPRDIHFVAQMVLAQKAHEGDGLMIKELKHQVNDQFMEQGLPSEFEMPPQPEPIEPKEKTTQDKPKKWQMCQGFGEINKVTEIAPVPQGDIQVKQLHLSGHCYIHIFDFAAGFYGIEIHLESQPYITFYIEGHGYFTYKHIPFGVTGGPSKFGHVTAERFHDQVAKLLTCET